MPAFRYKAVSASGEVLEGEMAAASREAAIARLQGLGHIPLHVEEAVGTRRWAWGRRRRLDTARFTRDLSTLLRAGVPLDRALEMLMELAEDEPGRRLLAGLLDDVRGGSALADAMEARPEVFGRFQVSMVRAAEAGGALETVLERLADFIEQFQELKASVQAALIYPAILVAVTLLSLLVLLVYVIPQFATLFEGVGRSLPLPTRVVMGVAGFVRDWGWLLLALPLLAIPWLRAALRGTAFRRRWDGWLLGMPLLGELVLKIQTSVFARTLGTLISSGVPLLSALRIVRDTLTNSVLAEAVDRVIDSAREGGGLAAPIRASHRFPPLVAHLIGVGEESGRLDAMLVQLAEVYDRETRLAIRRLLALLEPVLIIGLGLVVGGIIMSILVAILGINELAF
ncbi:type II secretion system F family protein [Thiofaba sp. EF100]|uniref:type II secretion system F family protein n=1 Tax=Thiofaba sp. EF100 TaxID=3121274 RepID=UPI003221C4A9